MHTSDQNCSIKHDYLLQISMFLFSLSLMISRHVLNSFCSSLKLLKIFPLVSPPSELTHNEILFVLSRSQFGFREPVIIEKFKINI